MKFLLGTKLNMTQVFAEDGRVIPVTRVQAGPCTVTQVKTTENGVVNAVQIGFGQQKAFRLNKAQQGHLKGLPSLRVMRDFRTDEPAALKRGDSFGVEIFEKGEKVQVTGESKGKGFQGVVKRHGFAGSPKTHGHKDQLRMPGSIGAGGVQRVFKGLRMGGHMGADRVTVKNLEIVGIDQENNELLIKGAVPGARGGLLLISTQEGTIDVRVDVAAEPAAQEAPVEAEANTAAEEPAAASEPETQTA